MPTARNGEVRRWCRDGRAMLSLPSQRGNPIEPATFRERLGIRSMRSTHHLGPTGFSLRSQGGFD